jgi:hypothetical protein
MTHIGYRFLLHFIASTGVLFWVFVGLQYLVKYKPQWPLPARPSQQLLLCCVVVVLFAFLREPLDVGAGGSLWKSYAADLPSWLLGTTTSALGFRWLIRKQWS